MKEGSIFTTAEVDTALCIFDELVGCTITHQALHIDPYWKALHENEGTPGLRQASINMCRPIEAAWQRASGLVSEEWGYPFDFEFIPALLAEAIETFGQHNLTEDQWYELSVTTINKLNLASKPINAQQVNNPRTT